METNTKLRAEIWKYKLRLEDEQEVHLPGGATVLSVTEQYGELVVYYWVLPDAEDREIRTIRIVGTGHSVDAHFSALNKYIGTVVTAGGSLVWHIFEGRG